MISYVGGKKIKMDKILKFKNEDEVLNIVAHTCAEFNLLYSVNALSGDGDILAQYSEHYGDVVEQLRYKQAKNDKIDRLINNMDTLLSNAPAYPYSFIGYAHVEKWQLQELENAYKKCRQYKNPLFMEIELLKPRLMDDTMVSVIVSQGTRGIYRSNENLEEDTHIILIGRRLKVSLIEVPADYTEQYGKYILTIKPE